MRFHSVTSANDIVRYHVILLNVANAHRREKDKSGIELNVYNLILNLILIFCYFDF